MNTKVEMNEYEYLIKQLNLLIGFLDVSDELIYSQIKKHDRFNMGITLEQLYESNYENYSNHICTSALLLGFSHFEDFLTKCIVKILIDNPYKNEIKVNLKTVIQKGQTLIASLAEEQARRLIFREKIKIIENSILGIDSKLIDDIRFVNDVRNCLMHHNGIADDRLAPIYAIGQKIVLSSGEVNGYGLKARELADKIWQIMNTKDFKFNNIPLETMLLKAQIFGNESKKKDK